MRTGKAKRLTWAFSAKSVMSHNCCAMTLTRTVPDQEEMKTPFKLQVDKVLVTFLVGIVEVNLAKRKVLLTGQMDLKQKQELLLRRSSRRKRKGKGLRAKTGKPRKGQKRDRGSRRSLDQPSKGRPGTHVKSC